MTLKIELVSQWNIFEWDDLKCPLCGCGDFVSLMHSAVYCGDCNMQFVVRSTAGDPGCVIDAFIYDNHGNCLVSAPKYACLKCSDKPWDRPQLGLFDFQDKTCPKNLDHGEMQPESRMWRGWRPIENWNRFCLVLKEGDYCGCWSRHDVDKEGRSKGAGVDLKHPTQSQWDAYQEKMWAKSD